MDKARKPYIYEEHHLYDVELLLISLITEYYVRKDLNSQVVYRWVFESI